MADAASTPPEPVARLTEIVSRLEQAATSLRDEQQGSERASALASECAQLASEAATELDRIARAQSAEAGPGQEELL